MNMRTAIVIVVVLGLIGLGLSIWTARKSQTGEPFGPAQGQPIKIGAILMLSGTGSNWGTNSQRGAELAVAEVNARGGVNGRPLQVTYEDNQGDSATAAVNGLQKLLAENIKIILGTNWTPSGLAVAPIACDRGVLMISPSLGVRSFNERCDSLFNVWPHDDVLSERLGQWLADKGYKKIAILGSKQEWEQTQSEAVKRGFTEKGGTIVAYELGQKDQKDFRTEVTKIKASNPDAVVFTNYSYEQISAKQLREQGAKMPFYSILMDDERIKGAHGAFEGTVVITSFTPTAAFKEKFSAKYNEQPDIGADTSYDAVMLIAEAMRKTGSTDPSVLKGYLGSLKNYSGASGALTFDGKRGVTKSAQFQLVKDGKLVSYQ